MTLHIIHLILSWVDFKGRNKMNYLFSTKDNNSGNEKLKMMNFLGGTDISQIKTCVEMNIKIII
jgi:hypothetical protein